jgi:hypothetical protein
MSLNVSHVVVLFVALAMGLIIGATNPSWVTTLSGGLVKTS